MWEGVELEAGREKKITRIKVAELEGCDGGTVCRKRWVNGQIRKKGLDKGINWELRMDRGNERCKIRVNEDGGKGN